MTQPLLSPADRDATVARPGERRFEGPAPAYDDAGLVFIGRIRSPWTERSQCPKNVGRAREAGQPAEIRLDPRWREGLAGLGAGQWVLLLTWLDQADRDLALQMPRHADAPRGTFSLRSPVRPNPVGLHLVQIVALDRETGIIGIDAIDVLNGTPLLDIKPYLASVDAPPA
ncbi:MULTISPECIES: tRNA (N6-threonylcarbamoyladenosine(37)-N6)-methyltransferase TrmO [Aurantimonas]|uniref:tRNA (N6-threonylcarbamoyladenosine(37)-N6)-methyltransferase TrmO n=1 Tax=Aurantimonas TaxID=182269 RepID=UPI003512D26B